MLRAVEDDFWEAGAKAAAPAIREATTAVFMVFVFLEVFCNS
jgi:hypothetical protein